MRCNGCNESCSLTLDVRSRRSGSASRVIGPPARTSLQMAVTLARRPSTDPILGRGGARPAHGEVRHRRRRPALRHDGPGREQERRAADPRLGVLTEDEVVVRNVPRIRDVEAMLAILDAIGVQVDWRGPNEVALCAADGPRGRDRARARRADQGLVPARRTAARALSPRGDAAAGRRRDRPPAPGPAPRRVPRDGRHRRLRTRDRAERPAAGCARPTCSWTSRR